MDEERMQNQRFRFSRENARYSSSSENRQGGSLTRKPTKKNDQNRNKTIRCKYCYRLGHHDSQCKQKEAKRPPSMPDWVSKAVCRKCNKKGHLSFNCPPKYENKPYKAKSTLYNRKDNNTDTAARASEFAGSATHYIPNQRMIPNFKSPDFAYTHHLHIMQRICRNSPDSANMKFQKIMQYLHNNDPRFNFYKRKAISFFMSHFNKIPQEDLITIIWVLCHLHSSNRLNSNPHIQKKSNRRPYCFKGRKFDRNRNRSYSPVYNHRSRGQAPSHKCKNQPNNHIPFKHCTNKDQFQNRPTRYYNSRYSYHQTAFVSQHELSARNNFPATDLEKGWIIDSGASAHMTPFRKDCLNVQQTYKLIYLADGSTVLCKFMGNINIPIYDNRTKLGTLILEDVLIVPNLDRRLFSVNAFLSKGHNWVHFTQDNIKLGIKNGPSINIPITSLQSNAFVVDHEKCQPKNYAKRDSETPSNVSPRDKRIKINTNILHE